jgi:gag-polyprotein putative aspartyl protease
VVGHAGASVEKTAGNGEEGPSDMEAVSALLTQIMSRLERLECNTEHGSKYMVVLSLNVEKGDPRPFADLKMTDGTRIKALLDTGAAGNFVSNRLARKIGAKRLKLARKVQVQSVEGRIFEEIEEEAVDVHIEMDRAIG